MLTARAKSVITSHFYRLGNPHLVTVTLDRHRPVFSGDPKAGLRHVRDHRSLSEFMRRLYNEGALATGRYVWVLEFQWAAWPHWHIAVDAKSCIGSAPYVH